MLINDIIAQFVINILLYLFSLPSYLDKFIIETGVFVELGGLCVFTGVIKRILYTVV